MKTNAFAVVTLILCEFVQTCPSVCKCRGASFPPPHAPSLDHLDLGFVIEYRTQDLLCWVALERRFCRHTHIHLWSIHFTRPAAARRRSDCVFVSAHPLANVSTHSPAHISSLPDGGWQVANATLYHANTLFHSHQLLPIILAVIFLGPCQQPAAHVSQHLSTMHTRTRTWAASSRMAGRVGFVARRDVPPAHSTQRAAAWVLVLPAGFALVLACAPRQGTTTLQLRTQPRACVAMVPQP